MGPAPPCRKQQSHAHTDASAANDGEGKPLLPLAAAAADVEASSSASLTPLPPGSPGPATLGADGKPGGYAWASSAFYRCLMLEEEALLASREALRSAVEFGTILAWFYLADRTAVIAPGTKVRAARDAHVDGG